MTAYDELTRTTVRAIPDERLPVCTWQKGVVEVRAVLPDPVAACGCATPPRRPSPPGPR